MSDLELPFQPVEASAGNFLAGRIDGAIAKLQSWGYGVASNSRLPAAAQVLRDVQGAGAFPRDPVQLVGVGNAIKIAFDYHQLVGVLEGGVPEGLRDILRRSLGGALGDAGPTEAHRAHSELHFGTLLASAGLRPGVPRPGRTRSPDFVVEVDSLPISVEVKRPGTAAAVTGKVEEAVSQLRDYERGLSHAVIVDVSDCLSPSGVIATNPRFELDLEDSFRKTSARAADYISARFGDPGFDRVLLLVALADRFLCDVSEEVRTRAVRLIYMQLYRRANAGLVVDQGKHLANAVVRGGEAMGMTVREQRRVK